MNTQHARKALQYRRRVARGEAEANGEAERRARGQREDKYVAHGVESERP